MFHLNADSVVRVVRVPGYPVCGLDGDVAAEHGQPREALGLCVSHLVLALTQPAGKENKPSELLYVLLKLICSAHRVFPFM